MAQAVQISPTLLLKHATTLAGSGGRKGRPSHTDLRRAVSACYYALFHQLCLASAETVMPKAPPSIRRQLARHLDHGTLRQLCANVADKANVWPNLSGDPKIQQVCRDFVDLHGVRQRADYDHSASFSRPEVLNLIQRSSQSVRRTATLKSTPDGQIFMGAMWAKLEKPSRRP
jgi:hypothetical protein